MIKDIKEINFPEYATLSQATVSVADMGEKVITTQIKIDGDIVPDFSYDWEVEWKGERYIHTAREPQAAKDNTSIRTSIDLTFKHWAIVELQRYYFVEMASTEAGTVMPDKYQASLGLTLPDFVNAFNKVLSYYYGDAIQAVLNPAWVASTERSFVEINYSYLWDVLQKVYDIYGVRWTLEPATGETRKYLIKFGYDAPEASHIFEYGYQGGLLKVERQVQSTDIRNILLGRGGEKNLPYLYFKDYEKYGNSANLNNGNFRPDPDAIPELKDLPFTELRSAEFRSYVQGWAAKHYNGKVKREEAYVKWAWDRGYTDAKFSPVEFVKDDNSIKKYGEQWGALDNNDDIHPTIQGSGVDDVVAVEEILSDEIIENDNSSVTDTVGGVTVQIGLLYKIQRKTYTSDKVRFVVPTGKVGVLSQTSYEVVGVINGNKQNLVIENSEINVFDYITDKEVNASAIPAGEYYFKWTFTVVNSFINDEVRNVKATLAPLALVVSNKEETPNPNVFNIWVKNLWETSKNTEETDEQYAQRVWIPILGTVGEEAKITFTTGLLSVSSDYEFTIVGIPVLDMSKSHNGEQSHWRITLAKSRAEYEATGKLLPNTQINAVAGDKFFFTGIELPHQYVVWAEERLHDYKEDNLITTAAIQPTWVVSIDKVRANKLEGEEIVTLVEQLAVGTKIRLANKQLIDGAPLELYVQSATYTWKEPSENSPYIYPDVEIVLSDKVVTVSNPVALLKGEIDTIRQQVGISLSNIAQLVRAVGDRIYLRKDGVNDVELGPISFQNDVSFEKRTEFKDDVIIGKEGYVGGLTGFGIRLGRDGVSEMDSLTLRRFLEVPELRYNRVDITLGNAWRAVCAGIVETVIPDTDEDGNELDSGTIYLKLEDGEIGSVAVDDICMGIFHNETEIESNATEDTDDGIGNFTFAGFATVYFRVTELLDEDLNGVFRYVLRAIDDTWTQKHHPQEGMTFSGYGNFTNKERQTSKYETRTYERYLKDVDTWTFSARNIAAQFGDLSNMSIFGVDMTGYSIYLNNIYMTGRIQQMNPQGQEVPVITDRGVWSASETYYKNDDVYYNNAKWRCLVDGTTSEPSKNNPNWLLLEEAVQGSSVTITSTSVTYQKSTSGTTTPTGTWQTSIPTTVAGEYLWTRTIVNYSDGKSTTSYSVAAHGSNGNDGTSVTITGQSVTYAVTDLSTQPDDSAFTSSTVPSVGLGQYLWSKTEIKYSDGTVIKSYSVSRIGSDGTNGVGTPGEDGKTSYLHIAYANSADGKIGFSTTYFTGALYIGTCTDFNEADPTDPSAYEWARLKGDAGRTYILEPSTLAMKRGYDDALTPATVTFSSFYRDGDSAERTAYAGRMIIAESTDGNTFVNKYTSSVNESSKVYTPSSKDVTAVRCMLYAAGGTTTMLDVQTTVILTDVSNVQPLIDEAKQAAEEAQKTVDSLKDFTDTAFADGIIDRAEAVAIEKYKNSVNETKKAVDASYNAVYTNSLLSGTAKSNLQAAKSAFDTAVANLLASVATASDDGIATADEKADVDAKYALFNEAYSTYTTRLEEAQAAIETAINTTAQGAYQLSEQIRQTLDNLTTVIIPDLQDQIDGQIVSWTGDDVPTLNNYPASDWKTDTEKKRHENDYYDRKVTASDGTVSYERYKFTKSGNTYTWERISDSGAAQALAEAREALGIAGSKVKLFYGDSTPSVPYSVNDIWIKTDGSIYICNVDRASGATASTSDWMLVNDSQARLRQMSSDSVISREEKAVLRNRLVQIENEFAQYQSDATKYGISITALTTAKNNLVNFLTGTVNVNSDTDTTLTTAQRTSYNTYFANYDAEVSRFGNLVADKLAEEATSLIVTLSNEYQGIPSDAAGVITKFPTCETTVTVYYGTTDVSAEATYSATPSGLTGSWNATTRTYTVTALSADTGYVDIKATYKGLTTTKRFNIAKTKAGADGKDGRGVLSTVVTYQVGLSGTTPPTGTWLTSPPATKAGQFLWTRTVITYTDDTTTTLYSVSAHGDTGAAGKGISSITEYYLATASGSGVTTSTSGWTTTVQTMDSTKQYLWNYEVIAYTDNTSTTTTPVIIGRYGKDGGTGAAGRGISQVLNYYAVTTTPTAPNVPAASSAPSSPWQSTPPTMSATNKYLWNYERVQYTSGTTWESTTPHIIAVYGDTGAAGKDARIFILEPSTYSVKLNMDGSATPNKVTLNAYYRDGSSETKTPYSGKFKVIGVSSEGEQDVASSTYSTTSFSFDVPTSGNISTLECQLLNTSNEVLVTETITILSELDGCIYRTTQWAEGQEYRNDSEVAVLTYNLYCSAKITNTLSNEDVLSDAVKIASFKAGSPIVSISHYYQFSGSGTTTPTGSWSSSKPTSWSNTYLWYYCRVSIGSILTYIDTEPIVLFSRNTYYNLSTLEVRLLSSVVTSGVTSAMNGWTTAASALQYSNIRYVDMVAVNDNSGNQYRFRCKQSHISTSANKPPTNISGNTYWDPLSNMAPFYTPLLLADYSVINFMQGNRLLIMDANQKVAAGFCGDNIPLWLGANFENRASAPFRVEIDGTATMSKAHIVAGDSNQRVELNPQTKSLEVYDSSNDLVSTFEGNKYTSVEQLLGSNSGTSLILSNTSGSSTVKGTTASARITDEQKKSLYSGLNTTTPVEFTFSGTFNAKSTVPTASGSNSSGTVSGSTSQASAYIELRIITRSSSSTLYDTNIISTVKVVSALDKNNSFSNVRAKVPNGYQYIEIYYNIYAIGVDTEASVSWSGITATYASEFYVARYFANGMCLGNRSDNYFLTFRDSYGDMQMTMQNKTGYGWDISRNGIKVKRPSFTDWITLPIPIFRAKVNYNSSSQSYTLDYVLNAFGTTTVSRSGEGIVVLRNNLWSIYESNCFINLTGYGTSYSNGTTSNYNAPIKASVYSISGSSVTIYLSDDDTRNDGSFYIEINMVGN